MRGAVLQALPTLALVSLLAVILLLLVPVLNRRAAAGVRCLIWGALLLRLLLPFSLYAPIQVDVEVPANSRWRKIRPVYPALPVPRRKRRRSHPGGLSPGDCCFGAPGRRCFGAGTRG